MSTPLPHYLRTHRKRACLTQDEMAFLLGCRSGAKISRYERNAREPNAKTIFAYQIIFRVPIQSLFAGTFQQVEYKTVRRVRSLIKRLGKQKSDPVVTRKIEILRKISTLKGHE